MIEQQEFSDMYRIKPTHRFIKYYLPLFFISLLALLPTAKVLAESQANILISEEAAGLTLHKNEISVATAEKIARACVAYAEKKKKLAAITILSPLGHIVYAYRMDGQTRIAVITSQRKAETVLSERISTHAVAAKYPKEMHSTLLDLGVFPFTGGLPVMLGDELIAAIGVGGMSGAEDEACAYHALTTVVGPQPPLVKD